MAVTFLALWGNGIRITNPAEANTSVVVVRPWGYEIRVDLTDGAHIWNEVFTYPSMPTKAKVRDDVIAKMAEIEARLYAEAHPPTKTVTCQDDYALIVPESICPNNIDLRINPTTQQAQAWNLIRPILKEYLVRVMSVYRAAPDEYKGLLREHNTLLNQSLSMMDE